MASVFSIICITVVVITMTNAVTSIPTREFDSMLETLRVRGYDLFCNAVVTSDLQFDLLSDSSETVTDQRNPNRNGTNTFTFFAPTDSSLFALDMTQTASSYTDTLRFHVVPRRLSISEIRLLPDGYTLPTLLPDRRLEVTRRLASSAIAVGGVDIAFPGLFYGHDVAVHGLAGILSLRSNVAADGVASNSPSPPLPPPPVVPPIHRWSFNATSRPGSPPAVDKIPPVNKTVHGPAPGPAASPVNGPEPQLTIHIPAPEPAATFHGHYPARAPVILGSSPISSTESPAQSYVASPAFTPISEAPRFSHSGISLPPVEYSDAAVPEGVDLHVYVRKRDSVSLLQTFRGDSNIGGGEVAEVKDEKSESLDEIRTCVTSRDVGFGLQHSIGHDHVDYMQCHAAQHDISNRFYSTANNR